MTYVQTWSSVNYRLNWPAFRFKGHDGPSMFLDATFTPEGQMTFINHKGISLDIDLAAVFQDYGIQPTIELYNDEEARKVAYRGSFTFAQKTYEIWLEFDFTVGVRKIKFSAHGTLPRAGKLKLKFLFGGGGSKNVDMTGKKIHSKKTLTNPGNPSDVKQEAVGFDFSDMVESTTYSDADDSLSISVPQTFNFDPTIVENTDSEYEGFNSHKIVRTADGSIHIFYSGTYYYSTDGGSSFNSTVISSQSYPYGAIAKDSNDNVYFVYHGFSQTGLYFKKATVEKEGSWSWSVGSEKTVSSAGAGGIPDLVIDSNNYFHATCYYASGQYPKWWYCTDGTGDTWSANTLGGATDASSNLCVDDDNNVYFVINTQTAGTTVYIQKATYNGGTSWSLGSAYSLTFSNAITAKSLIHVNDSGYIAVLCAYSSTSCTLYFRTTSKPKDITSWNSAVTVVSTVSGAENSFIYLGGQKWRVFYSDSSDSDVYYKETTNESSFGSATKFYTGSSYYLFWADKIYYQREGDVLFCDTSTSPDTLYWDEFTSDPIFTDVVTVEDSVHITGGEIKTTATTAMRYAMQRRLFYDSVTQLYWFFYLDDDNKIHYCTRPYNNTTWELDSVLITRTTTAEDFAVTVDSGYAYVIYTSSSVTYYRRIQLKSTGEVTLGTEVTVSSTYPHKYPSIVLDPDGKPVITYVRLENASTAGSWVNPSANSGTWSNGTNLYTQNAAYASTKTAAATHTAYGYSFSIPTNATITKVEVDAWGYRAGDDDTYVAISKDGGSSYGANNTMVQTGSNSETIFDVTSQRTGWVPSDFNTANNIRVRITYTQVGTGRSTNYVDYLGVRVTYTVPAYKPYVTKLTSNDGTYTADTGFPYELSSTDDSTWRVQTVALDTSGHFASLYFRNSQAGKLRVYNGSSWDTEVTTGSTGNYAKVFCATQDTGTDDLYLVYQTTSSNYVKSVKYTHSSNTFGTEANVFTDTVEENCFPIAWDENGGTLYLFKVDSSNTIQCYEWNGSSWSNATLITDTGDLRTSELQCIDHAENSGVEVGYLCQASSPYYVRFTRKSLSILQTVTDSVKLTDVANSNKVFVTDTVYFEETDQAIVFYWSNPVSINPLTSPYDDPPLYYTPQKRCWNYNGYFHCQPKDHYYGLAEYYSVYGAYSTDGDYWDTEDGGFYIYRADVGANGSAYDMIRVGSQIWEAQCFLGVMTGPCSLRFSKDTINSDGTITGGTKQTIESSTTIETNMVCIVSDSDGYPCVAYNYNTDLELRFRKASNTDGSAWGSNNPPDVSSGAKMLCLFNIGSKNLLGIWEYDGSPPYDLRWAVYNGTTNTWGSYSTLVSGKIGYMRWKATVDDDGKVYLMYQDINASSREYYYRTYTYAGGWTDEVLLEPDPGTADGGFSITVNNTNGDVYFLYTLGSDTVYYRILKSYGLTPRFTGATDTVGDPVVLFSDDVSDSSGNFGLAWYIMTNKTTRVCVFNSNFKKGWAITDSVVLTDSIERSVGVKTITETLLLADYIYKHATSTVTDSAKLTDAQYKHANNIVTDSGKLSDSILKHPNLTLTETILLADVLSKSVSHLLQESIYLSDVPYKHANNIVTDSGKLSDALYKHANNIVTDSGKLTDTVLLQLQLSVSDYIYARGSLTNNDQTSGGSTVVLNSVNGVDRAGTRKYILGKWVTTIGVRLSRTLNPTGDVNLTIRRVSDDSVIAMERIADASEISTSLTWYDVTFDTPVYVNEEVRLLVEFVGGDRNNFLTTNKYVGDVRDNECYTSYDSGAYTDAPTYDGQYHLRYYPEEVVLVNKNLGMLEGIYVADSPLKSGTSTLLESVFLSDELALAKMFSVTETILLTELASLMKNVSLSETVTLADALSLELQKLITESIYLSSQTYAHKSMLGVIDNVYVRGSTTNANQTTGSGQALLPAGTQNRRVGTRKYILGKWVESIGFKIGKLNLPTGDVNATIRRVSDDSIIAMKRICDAGELDGVYTWHDVTFDAPVYVNEEVRVLLEYQYGDGTNCVKVSYCTSNVLPDEVLTAFTESGGYTDYSQFDGVYHLSYHYPEETILVNKNLAMLESIYVVDALLKNWTATVLESILLSDELLLGKTFSITDTIMLTELASLMKNVSLSETVTLADALSLELQKLITESIYLSSQTYAHKSMSQSETVVISDTPFAHKNLRQLESVILSDASLAMKQAAISETINFVETQLLMKNLVQTETFLLSDLVFNNKTYTSVAETLLLVDQLFMSKSLSVSEQVLLLDVIMRDKLLALADSIILTDSANRGGVATLTESILFVDALLQHRTTSFVTDAAKLSDDVSIPTKLALLAETITLSDVVLANKSFVLSEIAYISDLIASGKITSVSDTVLLLDDLLVGKSMTTVSDNVKLLDAILNNKVFSETETVRLTDALLMAKSNVLTEDIIVTDAVLRHKDAVITDTITLLENILAGTYKNVSDAIRLIDAIVANEYLVLTDEAKLSDLAILHKSFSLADQILLADETLAHKYMFQTETVYISEEVIKEELITLIYVLDSLRLIDDAYAHKLHSIADTVTLTDSFVRDVRTAVLDAIYANDALWVDKSLVTVGDIVTLLDTVYGNKGLRILETILAVDATVLSANLNVTDFATLSDSLTIDKALVLSELARLTDELRTEKALLLEDVITILDAVEKYAGGEITIEEVVKLVDDIVTTKSMLLQETLTVIDAVLKHLSASLIENIYASDSISTTKTMLVSDYAKLVDILLAHKSLGVTETVLLLEQMLSDKGLTLEDVIMLGESPLVDKSLLLTDTVTLVDVVILGLYNLITENVYLTDTLAFTRSMTIAEVISFFDEIRADKNLTVADAVALADSVLNSKLIIVIDRICAICPGSKNRKVGEYPTRYYDDDTSRTFGNKT